MTEISVLNGVNLGALGTRRPEVYGSHTLQEVEESLAREFTNVDFTFRQTDYEGEMVGWVRESAEVDALIINPGAWTHYSYALHDALEAVSVPKVEVHLSNVAARKEDWRRHSVVSPVVDATIAGMGVFGYGAAVLYLLERLENR